MPIISNDIAEALWARACESEIGIAITSDDKRTLYTELYRVRSAAGNPEFDKIVIVNPKGNELFLIKKSTDLADARTKL